MAELDRAARNIGAQQPFVIDPDKIYYVEFERLGAYYDLMMIIGSETQEDDWRLQESCAARGRNIDRLICYQNLEFFFTLSHE